MSVNITKLGGVIKIQQPGKDIYELPNQFRFERDTITGKVIGRVGGIIVETADITGICVAGTAPTSVADFEAKLAMSFSNSESAPFNYTNEYASITNKEPPTSITWIQSETDPDSAFAASYQTNLTNYIAVRRAFLGYNVPFVILSLATGPEGFNGTNGDTIRAANKVICQTVSDCYLVSTDDLNTIDGYHYGTSGIETLATRIYNTTLTFRNGEIKPVAPFLTATDAANTLIASHALGASELETSTNDGVYTAYSAISVGNVARPEGYWKIRVKAAPGRNASSPIESPAFTIV